MSTRPALQPSAAPSPPAVLIRSGQGRRSPHSSDRLRRLELRFGRLMVACGLGYGPEDPFCADEAEAIAGELAAIFPPRPVHPPLWQQGGQAMW